MNFAKVVRFGLAVINFDSDAYAGAAMAHFGAANSSEPRWQRSGVIQRGLASLLNKYRNNKVMQDSVPEQAHALV